MARVGNQWNEPVSPQFSLGQQRPGRSGGIGRLRYSRAIRRNGVPASMGGESFSIGGRKLPRTCPGAPRFFRRPRAFFIEEDELYAGYYSRSIGGMPAAFGGG